MGSRMVVHSIQKAYSNLRGAAKFQLDQKARDLATNRGERCYLERRILELSKDP